MTKIFKSLRHFPADALMICLTILGVLSWTSHVELFRLGIPSLYEHVLAYWLLGLVMYAARGTTRLTLGELILLIALAAIIEAAKAEIPFRHPKVSDYFADLAGLGLSITAAHLMRFITRILAYLVTNRTLRYCRP